MKALSRKSITIISAVIFLMLSTILGIAFFATDIPCIGFYGLTSDQQKSIVDYLQKTFVDENGKEIQFGIITYKIEKPLVAQVKETPADLIFAFASKNTDELAKIQKNSGTVPLAFNPFTVVCDNSYPKTLENLILQIKVARTRTGKSALLPLADDSSLIQFISATVAAKAGASGYKKLAASLSDATNFQDVLAIDLADGITLNTIIEEIAFWSKLNIINENSFKTTIPEIQTLTKTDIVPITMMQFTEALKLNGSNAKLSLFPNAENIESRCAISEMLLGIPMTTKSLKKDFSSNDMLLDLQTDKNQKEVFGTFSFLLANTSVASENQATDNLRFALATAENIVPPLDKASFTATEKTAKLADFLRNSIEESFK